MTTSALQTTDTISFTTLGLSEPLLRSLRADDYETPTPIQAQAIPYLLAGRDLLGIAQTGTGKTAAFALPMLDRLSADRQPVRRGMVRALILTPTRELAVQIDESLRRYGRFLSLKTAVIFGGVGQKPQVNALGRGVDILVATPGRLLDLMRQGHVRFADLSILVLDEADRMLDMGFIHDVKSIVATLPKTRQTLFFSATMPAPIGQLADTMLKDPVRVAVTPAATTVERIEQRVYFVDAGNKRSLLTDLLANKDISRALVFTRTKHGADRVAEHIQRAGVNTQAIHGNKSQAARQHALNNFRDGRTRVLVATDIAARGIDIGSITHVINYEIPDVPDTYVHRIGRTARAGADGIALTFCDGSERSLLRDIERLTRQQLSVVEDHPYHVAGGNVVAMPARKPDGRRNGRPNGNRPNGGRPGGKPAAGRGNNSERRPNTGRTKSGGGPRG